MKLKLLLMFVMVASFNVSAVDVGEDQKSECIYAVQTGRSNVDNSAPETHTSTEAEKPKTVNR